jgi:protoporphyrinogen oxidase
MEATNRTQVVVVGGGFSGLAVAYELAKRKISVSVLEANPEVGGLASAFHVGGRRLERFYHHWFTSDHAIMQLIDELGLHDRVEVNPTRTGIYYANNFYKLSSPIDLLNFTPLSPAERIRLGLLTLRARRIRNWTSLEAKSAQEWLCELGGRNVYRIVWEPLLKGKFGPYADEISAVWFWNKLKLRGGSRGNGGKEQLAYFNGGFICLAEALAQRIRDLGGRIELNSPVLRISRTAGHWSAMTPRGAFTSDRIVVTTALPLIANMVQGWASDSYLRSLRRIQYLANVCLVLELDRSLSETYWLNVNDPSFPFVGVIEHTNFQRSDDYAGRHIVYLSKYLPHSDAMYSMDANELLAHALPYLERMFPALRRDWILGHHLWRARWSQPVVEKHYSRYVPPMDGPEDGFHICSMAQIYPEDRGTNYAVRAGQEAASHIAKLMSRPSAPSASN